QTRNDFKNPDQCTIGLMRVMFNPVRAHDPDPTSHYDAFWDGVGSGLDGAAGQDEWPYPETSCQGDNNAAVSGSLLPPHAEEGGAPADSGFAPASAQVACAATADEPSSGAKTYAQLNPAPGGFPVSVQTAETSTNIIRHPGTGTETVAKSIVK